MAGWPRAWDGTTSNCRRCCTTTLTGGGSTTATCSSKRSTSVIVLLQSGNGERKSRGVGIVCKDLRRGDQALRQRKRPRPPRGRRGLVVGVRSLGHFFFAGLRLRPIAANSSSVNSASFLATVSL